MFEEPAIAWIEILAGVVVGMASIAIPMRLLMRAKGSPSGIVVAAPDVTDRSHAEAERAAMIDAAPIGMMIFDETGLIVRTNPRLDDIFDYPRGHLIGQSVEILMPEECRSEHGALRATFADDRSGRDVPPQRQVLGRRRNGSAFMIEIMLNSIDTRRGRLAVASLFDVTERICEAAARQQSEERDRQAAQAANAGLGRLSKHLATARDRAEQASRAKSRFLAGMSHELRTPLTGILGYAQLLRAEGNLSEIQLGRVDAMLGAGKHLLEMITCVLDLSEIEAEHVELHPTEIDVQAIAAACLDLVRPMAEAKGLELSVVTAPGTPHRLVADPTRLRQILLNLMGNATKFSNEGAVALRISMLPDRSAMRIEVADFGPGISPELRKRLFQDFERLDTGANRDCEGAGLGLALSARLASLMGGSLGHEDNPGGGSVFWLELPLRDDTAAVPVTTPEPELPEAEAALALSRAFFVLVVDDVVMNREIAGSFLRSAGHTVICIESGEEAVAAVAGSDFDVVLMDVRMPGMDGLEATRRIRAMQGPRGRVPIIALTAQAFTEQVAECRKAGMNSHLGKPFDPASLLAAVMQAVAVGRTHGKGLAALVQSTRAIAPVIPIIGADISIVDQKAFELTTSFLQPETVESYLQTLLEHGTELLDALSEPDALERNAAALADAAHRLAGSAGMFGFERVATLGRRFERGVRSGSTDAHSLAEGLRSALEQTLRTIRERLPLAVG